MSSIQVRQGSETRLVPLEEGETLLSVLRSAGYSIPAACGGRGRCGKCRVPVNGVPRLACKLIPKGGDVIDLPASMGGVILTETVALPLCEPGRTGWGAAVDLGTTTVAVRVYDRATGALLGEKGAWNLQAPYGGDVISRIQYTMERESGLKELSEKIRAQVWQLLEDILERAGQSVHELQEIVVAGNTVMQHLFAGLPVIGIAAAPFHPETLFDTPRGDTLCGLPLTYAPCVAGYVGGDITAGLLASGLYEKSGNFLFLDIGTNGEMALGGKEGFSCCAVASGPAFEGAGITCGMPGISGAVSRVRYDRGFLYEVIGGGTAKGICGSGLLDLAAQLRQLGIIDESGRLLPKDEVPAAVRRYVESDDRGNGRFYLTPEVYLTAEDVRNLQLAKAAVAGGIQVLLRQRGISPEQVDGLYLAGGFGSYMDPNSAAAIGMLPRTLADRCRTLGNTALAGASMVALDRQYGGKLQEIARQCSYLELSGNPAFTEAFTESMTF